MTNSARGYICCHCNGKGCDKCHQGWECTNFCEEYHPWYPLGSSKPIKDDHYGLECGFCTIGWKIGGQSTFNEDNQS